MEQKNEVTINLNELGHTAKDGLIKSLSTANRELTIDSHLLEAAADLNHETIETLVKIADKRLDEMTRLKNELAQANATVILLRGKTAQPARNPDYEMVMSFLKVSYGSAYHFFTALKAQDYAAAARTTPTDIAWELEKIPLAQKIERIKVLRNLLPGLGLKEAKDFIDQYDEFLKHNCPF